MFRELGDRYFIAQCLDDLGSVDAAQGAPERAARLFAAAAALRASIGAQASPRDQLYSAPSLAAVRGRLGAAAFAARWAEGQAMTLDEAIAAALASPPRPAAGPLDPGAGPAAAGAGAAGLSRRELERPAPGGDGAHGRPGRPGARPEPAHDQLAPPVHLRQAGRVVAERGHPLRRRPPPGVRGGRRAGHAPLPAARRVAPRARSAMGSVVLPRARPGRMTRTRRD